MLTIEKMNRKLRDLYGSQLDGKPNFRLTFSTPEVETRFGQFNDFYGQIFVRTFVGVRKVPKYPLFPDRWILEKFQANPHPEEILGSFFSYEPLFVFETLSKKFIKPEWKAVNYLVHEHLFRQKPKTITLTDEIAARTKEQEDESKWMYEYLNDLFPETASALIHGEAVSVPSNYGVALK